MIRSATIGGVAFGTLSDGEEPTRAAISAELAIGPHWATINQIHGAQVLWANAPGVVGDADGLATTELGLPLAIRTADCVPVVVETATSVGVVHAGWRGVAAGVVPQMIDALRREGQEPIRASIGPHIGPCCYEVGDEVVAALGGYNQTTRWGTTSVSLRDAIADQLPDMNVEVIDLCTYEDTRFASYRRDATQKRQVTVVWRS